MPRYFQFVHGVLLKEKQDMENLYELSTNEHRAFQSHPIKSFDEDRCTRLIDGHFTRVCLILYQPGSSVDQTIYGSTVCYPPPIGIKNSDVKRSILEATLPIPTEDYEGLIKRKTLPDRLIKGDAYTKVVQVVLSGSVYIPYDNAGLQVTGRRYSKNKGWYRC